MQHVTRQSRRPAQCRDLVLVLHRPQTFQAVSNRDPGDPRTVCLQLPQLVDGHPSAFETDLPPALQVITERMPKRPLNDLDLRFPDFMGGLFRVSPVGEEPGLIPRHDQAGARAGETAQIAMMDGSRDEERVEVPHFRARPESFPAKRIHLSIREGGGGRQTVIQGSGSVIRLIGLLRQASQVFQPDPVRFPFRFPELKGFEEFDCLLVLSLAGQDLSLDSDPDRVVVVLDLGRGT